ncbi:glycosyltransferase family 4 protein [Psychromonas ingrahamii]|nr:glycosyltransferase family 4 protein [Psychromonas ingrahamii]
MNILELCLSDSLGGLELHFRDFSVWLDEQQSSEGRIFVATRSETPLASRMESDLCLTNRNLWHAARLSKFISANKIDVVHIHDKKDLPLLALVKSICSYPFKLAHTRHMSLPGGKRDFYHSWLYGKVDAYFVITEWMKSQVINNLPLAPEKIHKINLGTAVVERCSETELSELKDNIFSEHQGLWLANIARIQHGKGQHVFLDAIKQLKDKGIQVAGVIAGGTDDPQYVKQLEDYIELHQLKVKIFGHRDDIPVLIQAMDAVVLTTECETFGLIMIEAMMAGVVAIGSNSGGVPEIIDHLENGLLFNVFDPQDLSKQIQLLDLSSELKEKLALKGQQKALQRFEKKKQFLAFKEKLLNLEE